MSKTAAVKTRFRNGLDVETKLCIAFARLGELAGIKVGAGNFPEGIDVEVVDAVEQAYHQDPHFLDGPGIFSYIEDLAGIERVFENGKRIETKLLKLIEDSRGQTGIELAEPSLAMISAAHDWARKRFSK